MSAAQPQHLSLRVIANPSRELTEQVYYTVNAVVGTKQEEEEADTASASASTSAPVL
jgi:hypothetical protein